MDQHNQNTTKCVCARKYMQKSMCLEFTQGLLHIHTCNYYIAIYKKKKCKVHTQTKKCKVQTQTKKCKAQTQMYMPSCMHSSITSFQYHCIKCYNYVNFYNSASRLAAHYVIMPNGCNSTSYRSVSSCKKNQPQPKKQIRRKKIKHTQHTTPFHESDADGNMEANHISLLKSTTLFESTQHITNRSTSHQTYQPKTS